MPETSTSNLRVDDVIVCDKFVHGIYTSRFHKETPIQVGLSSAAKATDESRRTAKYRVLMGTVGGELYAFAGPDDTWSELICQRLADDGSLDPKGELIKFAIDGQAAIEVVDLVGRLSTEFVSL